MADPGKIHEAIRNVQRDITDLEQTEAQITHKGGGQHSYTYLAEPTLMTALKPLLAQHGIAVYPSCEDRGKDGNLYRSRATLVLAHEEDDSQVVVYGDGQASASDDKGLAMAHTSAFRQCLQKLFQVPNYRQGEDPEQRPAPPVQDANDLDIENAIQRVMGLAETKGLEVYASQQIAKAADRITAGYLRELYAAIKAAEPAAPVTPSEPSPPAETPAVTPPAASPQNGSQGHLQPLYDVLGQLQSAQADGNWAQRMENASQQTFGRTITDLDAEQAGKLHERMQATLAGLAI